MCLRIQIARIHKSYSYSVVVLTAYVRDIDSAIQKIQADHEILVNKIAAVRAGEPDPTEHVLGEKLIQLELSEKQVDLIFDVTKLAQSHAAVYPNMAFRMSFVYLIALFDAFLSDIFEAVVRNRPEMLRSKKQITYEKALEFSSVEDLVKYLAKRELNELSYRSIKDQADYYNDRFGLALADSGVSIDTLAELRATRNLLVHNNGIVNDIYLEQIPITTYMVGDSVVVDSAYFGLAIQRLDKVVTFVALKLTEKHVKWQSFQGEAL